MFATKSEADTTYGLFDRHGNFYIGNKPVVIIDNNIVVEAEECEGTPGLWELIVSKNPTDYTDDDYDNYARLMLKTNTLHRDNNPDSNHSKSSKGQKWKRILKQFGIIGQRNLLGKVKRKRKSMRKGFLIKGNIIMERVLCFFRAILTHC